MSIFREIDKLNRIYLSLLPLKDEYRIALDRKIKLEYNFNTNHIEGNTLTYSETELLLYFDNVSGNHSLRDIDEMRSSDLAFTLIKEWAADTEQPLTEQNIKNLNELLLVKPFWKDAITPDGQKTRRLIKIGNYKEFPNSVMLQNGEVFHYASPQETPILMGDLIRWYIEEEEKKELHPAYLASLLHYRFVRIHPFDDGNGRIARLLMNYVLIRHNYPPVIIKSEDKKNYLFALNKADTGDIEAFCNYIAEQLVWSLQLSIKAAKGENIDEKGDLDKKIKLLKQKYNSKEESIKQKKSKETIKKAFENNIETLLLSLSNKLSEFDVLFKSKAEIITSLKGGGNTSENINDNFQSILEGIMSKMNEGQLDSITYKCSFNGFRKSTKSFNVEITLVVTFHQYVYELSFPKGTVNKRYDEVLSKEDMTEAIEKIGIYLIDRIEELNH
jgi:Fic family protein